METPTSNVAIGEYVVVKLPKANFYTKFILTTGILLLSALLTSLTITSSLSASSPKCSKTLSIGFPNIETASIKDNLFDPVLVDIAIFKKSMEFTGCPYTLENFPWKRTINAVKHGEIDGAFDVSLTTEREEFGRYSLPYREEKMGIVMRLADIPNFEVNSFSDIVSSRLTIGTNIGYWYGEQFDKAYNNNPAFRKRVLRTSLDMTMGAWLTKDRVDMFFIEQGAAKHIIAAYDYDDAIGLHPFVLNSAPLHIFLSKKTTTQGDIEVINTGLRKLFSSDLYKRLLAVFSKHRLTKADRELLNEILELN
ncbi:MAG: substrate-binding periplasmic protein [Kordiimonas sp.]